MFKFMIIFSGLIFLCEANYGNISLIEIGESCSMKNGEKGAYVVIHLCEELLRELKLMVGKFPKVCEINEMCWDVVC